MKVMFKIFAINAISIFLHQAALAGCVTSHQECEYQCIEYYPNGTDCKKSKKVCHEVCEDFDVNTSGGTPPHVPINPSLESTSNSNAVHPPSMSGTATDINTNGLTPTTGGCVSAEGNGQTVNCD